MGATTCPNCKTRLSCGCQTRKASNGTSVCTNCIGKYEAKLKVTQKAIPAPTETSQRPN